MNTQSLLDRSPPHSLESEKGVLGSMLLDPRTCDDVALVVRAEDFYSPNHRKLFEHLLDMHNAGGRIDLTLLVERLKSQRDFEALGGTMFLVDIAESVPTATNAVWYAKAVADKSEVRRVALAATETLRDAYACENAHGLAERAEQRLQAAAEGRDAEIVTLSAALAETMDGLNDRIANGRPTGIATPWRDVDRHLGGLRPGELVIVAARPGCGKTSLALNIATNAAERSDAGVLFVSLEMSRRELCERMLSARSDVNSEAIREGRLTASERDRVIAAQIALDGLPIAIDDQPRRTLADIAAQARRLKRADKLALLVVDYLSLIEPENHRDPRHEQVAKLARRLKMLARELAVPVLCLAQLNREVEKAGEHRPKLSHLRESGAIEQDADAVLFVHREELYRPHDLDLRGKAELIISKNRNGSTGIVPLTWNGATTSFLAAAARGKDGPYDFGVDEE